jgi:hypothetical protein
LLGLDVSSSSVKLVELSLSGLAKPSFSNINRTHSSVAGSPMETSKNLTKSQTVRRLLSEEWHQNKNVLMAFGLSGHYKKIILQAV